jgi:hypothetical protein
MSYTAVPGPGGSIRYKKNNRFVKKSDIPADILIKLEVGMTDITEQAIEPEIHKCIFCNMVTKQYRLLNSKPVYLCEDDYYDKTLGQVAQKLNQEVKV